MKRSDIKITPGDHRKLIKALRREVQQNMARKKAEGTISDYEYNKPLLLLTEVAEMLLAMEKYNKGPKDIKALLRHQNRVVVEQPKLL